MTWRIKLLQKIAQTTDPNIPTDEVAKTKTVAGSPPNFIATDYYPTINVGFNPANANIINYLTGILNQGLFYTSDGKINLSTMKSSNFNTGTTAVSENLKNLMNFGKEIFTELFNNGVEFKQKLTPEEISARVSRLKSSQFLNNLPATNITGQLANKIGGDIKTILINSLTQIK